MIEAHLFEPVVVASLAFGMVVRGRLSNLSAAIRPLYVMFA